MHHGLQAVVSAEFLVDAVPLIPRRGQSDTQFARNRQSSDWAVRRLWFQSGSIRVADAMTFVTRAHDWLVRRGVT